MLYQEQSSHDKKEPLCLIYKVQFVDITPIDSLMDCKHPKIYQHDCNLSKFSLQPFMFQSTYL